ncbi:Adenylosuccinate synthetase like protein [Verticillium longisporum]|uniref:Adenylosuccinate synthetase like protein n=1 Tax=Verticillium longisporum TaxID=100787 RepID=A0A8I2ZHT0_VERLO|nr:Adenylosuccinate synthetase like protein [Verticillium longisporum]
MGVVTTPCSIVANGVTYDFHLLPSGLMNPVGAGRRCNLDLSGPYPALYNLIGSDAVVHVSQGLPNVHGRVRISDCCSVDFDLHNAVDGLEEIELRAKSIGTTRRGIGPACSPRVSTTVITICEKFDGELFERKLRTPAASALEGGKLKLRLVSQHAYDYSQGLLRPAKEARNFILFIEKFLSVNDKGPKIRRVGTGPVHGGGFTRLLGASADRRQKINTRRHLRK